MTRVKLVEDALSNPHAGGGVSTIDVGDVDLSLAREVPSEVTAEGLGEHGFPAPHRTRDDGSGGAFGRANGREFGGQGFLKVFSTHEFFGEVVKIQNFRMGDDEPSANPVQVARHIKGMLMSTVLKDVVGCWAIVRLFSQETYTNQGISSNW
jgi:hypothetical protein